MKDLRRHIISSPVYHIEGINGMIHDLVLEQITKNLIPTKQISEDLDIDHQFFDRLFSGEDIDISVDKMIKLITYFGKCPVFKIVEIDEYDNTINKI